MAPLSKPVLYGRLESTTVRTAFAVSRILGFEIELKNIDLQKKEHLTPEFLKINPFHCIPTFVDSDGFALWESRAIATYLIESRSKGKSTLYPSDLKKRATVDKFLYYDTGKLAPVLSAILYATMQGEDPTAKVTQAKDVLKTLNDYFANQNSSIFIAGNDELSIADIAIHFTLGYLDVLSDLIDAKQYPEIGAFNDKVKQALKPFQPDGLFDNAHQSSLKLVEGMKAAQKLAQK